MVDENLEYLVMWWPGDLVAWLDYRGVVGRWWLPAHLVYEIRVPMVIRRKALSRLHRANLQELLCEA